MNEQCFLIEFSGIDGAGKSTLIRNLLAMSAFTDAQVFKKTYRENANRLARFYPEKVVDYQQYLSGAFAEQLRFAGTFDFLYHYLHEVKPQLGKTKFVFLDRWKTCVIAYAHFDQRVSSEIAKMIQAVPDPDLTIFLDIPPEVGYQRICERGQPKGDEHLEILKRFSDWYEEILPQRPNKIIRFEDDQPDKNALKVKAAILESLILQQSESD